jgi:hypothetical protein
MRARATANAFAGVVLTATLACSSPPSSVMTSLRGTDCGAPSPEIKARFDQKDLGVEGCAGAEPWQVLVVSADANSWIELRSPTTSWSAEHPIVYETPIGLFPGIDDASPLEWRSAGGGGLTALLFTVSAQDPADAETRISRVFVARIEDGGICIIGRERTLDEARALADSDASCLGR